MKRQQSPDRTPDAWTSSVMLAVALHHAAGDEAAVEALLVVAETRAFARMLGAMFVPFQPGAKRC